MAKFTWNGEKFKADLQKANNKTLLEAAFKIRSETVPLVPVDTGLLRNSINFAVSGDSKDFKDVDPEKNTFIAGENIKAGKNEAIVGTAVFYGPYVEYGTRKMQSQPFLLPGFLASVKSILQFAKKNIQDIDMVE